MTSDRPGNYELAPFCCLAPPQHFVCLCWGRCKTDIIHHCFVIFAGCDRCTTLQGKKCCNSFSGGVFVWITVDTLAIQKEEEKGEGRREKGEGRREKGGGRHSAWQCGKYNLKFKREKSDTIKHNKNATI